MPFQTHVSVAKAGIDALSHSVAIEYGPRGLTSNIIAPGPIAQTEVSISLNNAIRMSKIDQLTILQGLERLLPSDALEAYTKAQPLGRFGHVRDIADATVYLFSDTGSYVSGQTLVGELSDNTKEHYEASILTHKQLMVQTGACRQAVLPVGACLTRTSCFRGMMYPT